MLFYVSLRGYSVRLHQNGFCKSFLLNNMKINYRKLTLCSMLAALGLGSCISFSNELDMTKEISLDMQIAPGGLYIPIGSLDTIYLDSLIQGNDDSVLDTLPGGVYGLTMSDSIQKITVDIETLEIDIPSPDIEKISTHFDTPTKEDLSLNIPSRTNTAVMEVASINLSEINSKLPSFQTGVTTPKFNIPAIAFPQGTAFQHELNIPSEGEITKDITFEYTLPEDVKTLNKIYFGESGSTQGQLITLNVDLAGVYSVLNNPKVSIKTLNITFPDNFVLGANDQLATYVPAGQFSANDNVFSISMTSDQSIPQFTGESKILPISFYLKEADFKSQGHDIDYKGTIKYSLVLDISGTSKGGGDLYVQVDMSDQLKMADFSVDTKAKSVELASDTITSDCKVMGLDGMKRINSIQFDQSSSYIRLKISDFDIAPFSFGSSSRIRLVFSNDFEFDKSVSLATKGGTWTTVGSDSNVLDIDPSLAKGQNIDLVVKSLAINQDVDKLNASITLKNDVSYNAAITIDAKENLRASDLDALKDIPVEFEVSGALVVEDADFVNSAIRTDISKTTTISVDEMVDPVLKELSRIDLTKPAGVSMNLKFKGIPSSIDTLTLSSFTITFPDFLSINYLGTQQDSTIYLAEDGKSLVINKVLTQNELADDSNGFTVADLKIEGLVFNKPIVLNEGHLILEDQKVSISGSATMGEENLGLSGLGDIEVYPTVKFDPICVKSIYGKVDPEIDPVHEEIKLDLGDNDIFNGKNSLSLSDPEIVIDLTSSITVPITIDMSISSLDSKGNYIARDVAPDMGTIRIKECDSLAESRKTTLVIFKNERQVSSSDDTIYVRLSRLSELMASMPDKIVFNLTAGADQSVNHYVDLSRELAVSGEYKVTVPLEFDNLYFEYSDTIKDLSADLNDIADKIDATSMNLIMETESTIPLGISLDLKAYDSNWKEIPGIKVSSIKLPAGSESHTPSSDTLSLKVEKGALEKLESIIFTAVCESGEGTSSIRKGQWLHVGNLKFHLPEGLKVDLTEEKNAK